MKANLELRPEVKPVPRILTIRARTRQSIAVPTVNSAIEEGYLPRVETKPGEFIGEAAVTNKGGECHVLAINTTQTDVSIEIPPQKLVPFEYMAFSSEEDFLNTGEEPIQAEKRVDAIMGRIKTDHLNSEELAYVEKWIKSGHDRFLLPGDKLPITTFIKHYIPTVDEEPVKSKQYRQPQKQEAAGEELLDKMRKDDMIVNSTSPYNSPLLIVPKKPDEHGNKRWRLVIDFRALNEKTIGDSYPLPNVNESLERLGGAQYFSVFDLALGYHQVGTAEEDQAKTAFSTKRGHIPATHG